ncbi:hypothetical protein [Pseudoduganella lutea]|uniref:Uncharacterized protein n=1 Tax=Pseudoduganella lutea TaxID=321985 RepID=A0A4P6L5D3_9BURK|nr:hypothetical protein [Pseudoduganella lutea]QBE66830.1 hypothetical protein EWM63_30875 [Pseudoduganella lutea]
MTDKATEKELGEVHGGMADWCKLILRGVPLMDKEGNAVLQPDGQPWLVPPSPAHLNVIRQFLKDNRIEAASIPGLEATTGLDDLPVFDDDNVVPLRK